MFDIAVIGAGNWGKNFVRNFHEIGALKAVSEVAIDIRQKLEKEFTDVHIVRDYEEILNSEIPAVAIATPAPTHFELAKKFLEAGKDVFVEKPMCMKVAEAEELLKISQDKNRILMTGHLLLYQPAIQFIKKYIDDGKLGKIHSLHQERLNLGRARNAENVLWSLGVHDIAVLLYLIDKTPEKVIATGQHVLQDKIEDDTYLHMTFEGGLVAHLHNSWLWHEKHRMLNVIGEKAMLTYNELEQTVTLHNKTIDSNLQNQDNGSELIYKGEGQPLRLECEHFLNCCATREKPVSDGASALEVIKILEAATAQMS